MSLIERLAPKEALRTLDTNQVPRVTTLELFFDLVYVFTIIQLSHYLLHHMSWHGALEAVTLFAAIWWAWNYTAWSANWMDPDHKMARVVMILLMACALIMAIAIPKAYGERALVFASAYVFMALIRAFYMATLFRGEHMGQNYTQLAIWSAVSGFFWIAGALYAELRVWLWIMAVVIDYSAPYLGFWVPGRGATRMDSWPLEGLHLFERNQLIFIIALGESILLLGAMLVEHELHATSIAAGAVGFLLIVTIWWIYFVDLSEPGEHRFAHAKDHTSLARAGLTYAHGIMVCGAIVMAVAIEMFVAHPNDAIHADSALVAFFGPTLFLIGATIFHRTMLDRFNPVYFLTIAVLGLWCWMANKLHMTGLFLGLGVLIILLLSAGFGSLKRSDLPESKK